ncbi:MAG TPA: hypothetical protein VEY50_01320 [Lysobacter sp.]|nr:hypothetical protein [Lysobacter sp.]
MVLRFAPLLILLLLPWWPHAADAQLRRCRAATGELVYTDRPCDTLGADEEPAPLRPAPNARAWTCARSVEALVAELTWAIDSQDPDGLVRIYHWSGLSSDAGYTVAERLQRIAERPLLGIDPLMPSNDGDAGSARRAPVALRVQQTDRGGTDVSSTVLGLHRHRGCWWIRF